MEQEKKLSKSKSPRKIQLNGNQYIQQALEKALIDLRKWEDWRQILGRLHGSIQGHYRDESIEKAMGVLYHAISIKENEAWKHSFMWALGMPDETRKRILDEAKKRFLVSDDDHISFEIMPHLDPRLLIENEDHESQFREAIREYFKLDENVPK